MRTKEAPFGAHLRLFASATRGLQLVSSSLKYGYCLESLCYEISPPRRVPAKHLTFVNGSLNLEKLLRPFAPGPAH